jgi:predicted nuclease of predicted toxin-antitoxin system
VAFSLYIDEDSMNRRLTSALRTAGIDVITTSDAGNDGNPDHRQLEFARGAGRVLLTANMKDFAALHTLWITGGLAHAGIIIVTVQRANVGVLYGKLVRLQSLRDRQAMLNAVLYLNGRADQPLE